MIRDCTSQIGVLLRTTHRKTTPEQRSKGPAWQLSGSLRVAGDALTCYGIERLIRNRWIFQQRRISGHHASGPKGLCGTAIQSLSITAEERWRTTSLAALAFHAKDALFVIDDFAPQGQQ